MCWNEQVSWISLIVGTIINASVIGYFNNPVVTAICLAFEYSLLMQLFEALAWRYRKNREKVPKSISMGACIANVTQVLFTGLIFLAITPQTRNTQIAAVTIMVVYILLMGYYMRSKYVVDIQGGDKNCHHLSYSWWNPKKTPNGTKMGYVYIVTLILLILLLIKPFHLGVFIAIYVTLALILSNIIYSCGSASLWCWFVASAGFFTAIYLAITNAL